MNPVVEAQLNQFKKANPDIFKSDSEYFEVLAIFAMENGLLGENIDPFDAHLRGDEFGVDGAAILVQGSLCRDTDDVAEVTAHGNNHSIEFHFFQSKTSEKMDYGDVSKFVDGVYDFFTGNKLLCGDQVADLVAAKNYIYSEPMKNNPVLRCYFCTTGSDRTSDAVGGLIEASKKRFEELNIFSSVEIAFVGAKQIQDGYRSATNSNSATLTFKNVLTLPPHESVDEAYMGYIQADNLLEIVLSPNDGDGNRIVNRAVFYDNVRDFNPDSEINNAIAADIKSGGSSSFVFKNNGVTVVAKSISRKSDVFSIEDYQIVNGCQTTNVLAENLAYAPNIFVPLRLIGSKNGDFISSIIIGTNKQNEVKADQFWALLPFMKDLEEYSQSRDPAQRIFIERRENQYRNTAIERARITKPSDLMKAAAAMFFYQPNRAARDYRGIRSEFRDRIFHPSHNVELYHLAAFASYKFSSLVRTSKIERARNIYKFYCLFAMIKKSWPTPNVLDANRKDQGRVVAETHDLLNNETQLLGLVESVSLKLDSLVGKDKTREQVRDAIRSDSTFSLFKEEF